MKPLLRWITWGTGTLLILATAGYFAWRVDGQSPTEVLANFLRFIHSVWNAPLVELGSFQLTLALIFQGGIFLLILWFVTGFASRVLRTRVLDRMDLDEGLKFSVQRLAMYLLFTLGALNLLPMLGLNVASLAVFSGALGIGIGIGFQSIAKNFASGLILLFEQPIKVGDRVQLGDLRADVVKIGARGTWVRTNDNIVMIVPNSEFLDGRVTNWTANDRSVRMSIPLGVSYGSDPEHVRSVLFQVAKGHPDVLDEPNPDVIFTGFGDSSLDFAVRVWTSKQVTTPGKISSQLYFGLFAALKQEDIEIPFPQRDLHIKSAPAPAGRPHPARTTRTKARELHQRARMKPSPPAAQ